MFSITPGLVISQKCVLHSIYFPVRPACVLSNKLLCRKDLPGSKSICMNRSIYNGVAKHKCMQITVKCPSSMELQPINIDQKRVISTTTQNLETAIGFWERDPKGKYAKEVASKEALRAGLKELKFELIKWKQEVRDAIAQDPLLVFPGDRDTVWVFSSRRRSPTSPGYNPNPSDEASPLNPITSINTSRHDVQQSKSEFDGWMVSCDSDVNEGYSSAQLTTSSAGHGLFNGDLSTKIPKDGQIHRAGYCIMRSLRPAKSFGRKSFFDWGQYTHMVIRCRGDGRSYIINLASAGSYDISWNNMFSYVLYTRGGPHWQTYKVPFSRFMFSSKGKIQDKQSRLDASKITSVGFAVGDKINAPFRLEIDYIGLENDPIHTEESAYELYNYPAFYLTL